MSAEVRFGIIGCGLMGREFASVSMRWLHLTGDLPRPVIVAACDASPERLAAYTPLDEMRAAPGRPLETAATVLLLAYGIAMVVAAAPLLDYTRATAAQLQSPGDYVQQVRAATPALREP